MYQVQFLNSPQHADMSFTPMDFVVVEDLERALALASMLQKISTPKVQFGDIQVLPFKDIQVKPFNSEEHETQKK